MLSLLTQLSIQTRTRRSHSRPALVSDVVESNEICEKPLTLQTNIFQAIYDNDYSSFRYLLCTNSSGYVNQFDKDDYDNPLMYTLYKERYGMALDIVNKYNFFLKVNYQNKYGSTALHYAYREKHNAIVCKLLDLGADTTIYNAKGEIPSSWGKGWKPSC